MAAKVTLSRRLEDVGLGRRVVRRTQVEEALWQHLSAVAGETDDFEWVSDLEEVRARA